MSLPEHAVVGWSRTTTVKLPVIDFPALRPGARAVPAGVEKADIDLVGATWRFRCRFSGRHNEVFELVHVLEVDVSLATSLRDR